MSAHDASLASAATRPELAERELEALDAYSRTVAGVAERLAPSVANLRVTRVTRRGRMPAGAGSGVVLTPDGFLLTSAHVVAGRGRQGRAAFVDGREFPFSIVGQRPALGPRRGAHRGAATSSPPRSATPSGCASASWWSRSATRTGSPAR